MSITGRFYALNEDTQAALRVAAFVGGCTALGTVIGGIGGAVTRALWARSKPAGAVFAVAYTAAFQVVKERAVGAIWEATMGCPVPTSEPQAWHCHVTQPFTVSKGGDA